MEGLRVLEPSAGSGNFVKGSSRYNLNWVSNEPYLEYAQGFEPDHQGDFKEESFRESLGKFDIVIGNPPPLATLRVDWQRSLFSGHLRWHLS